MALKTYLNNESYIYSRSASSATLEIKLKCANIKIIRHEVFGRNLKDKPLNATYRPKSSVFKFCCTGLPKHMIQNNICQNVCSKITFHFKCVTEFQISLKHINYLQRNITIGPIHLYIYKLNLMYLQLFFNGTLLNIYSFFVKLFLHILLR